MVRAKVLVECPEGNELVPGKTVVQRSSFSSETGRGREISGLSRSPKKLATKKQQIIKIIAVLKSKAFSF